MLCFSIFSQTIICPPLSFFLQVRSTSTIRVPASSSPPFRARPRFLGRQSGRLPALWKVTIRQVRLFRSLSRHLCSASKHHRKGLHRWICEAVDLWGTGTPQGTSLLNPKTSPRVFPSESSSDRPQGDDDGEDDGLLRCPTSQGGLLHAINRLSRPWLP